ncbi:MAG: sulfur carrier protein ThiS [Bacteroidetes bacterium]|nr:sulfur carrier protein ThiS [Bacteroidota bacterium]
MKIILNHLPEEIFEKEEISIRELLNYKKYSFKMLVIKVNNQLIKNDQYETTFIKEGDDVIVLHLMSGG